MEAPLSVGRLGALISLTILSVCLGSTGFVSAAAPLVTISANGAKIQIASASLSEAIDAFSRAAGFKVTYEGARPGAMLFNADIDTPSVSQSLSRLLEGQNLNYGVVYDMSGKKVTSLMIFGMAAKAGAAPAAPASGGRPQPFATPRTFKSEPQPVDDEPEEAAEPEPEPAPQPTPVVAPVPGRTGGPAGTPASPFPPSPFGPRSPFGSPLGARPTPPPVPSPSP